MKRYLFKMTAAALTGMILTGCSPAPAFANSEEDPNEEAALEAEEKARQEADPDDYDDYDDEFDEEPEQEENASDEEEE